MLDHPINPFIPSSDVAMPLERMSNSGFQGRKFDECYLIWKEMIETLEVSLILGLSGAMVPAGSSITI